MKRVDQRMRKDSSPSATSSCCRCSMAIFRTRHNRGYMARCGRACKAATPRWRHTTKAPTHSRKLTNGSFDFVWAPSLSSNILLSKTQNVAATRHSKRACSSVSVRPHCGHREERTTPNAARRSHVGRALQPRSHPKSRTSAGSTADVNCCQRAPRDFSFCRSFSCPIANFSHISVADEALISKSGLAD